MSTPTAHPLEKQRPRTRQATASAPLNLCALCRQDFSSLRLFDAHFVGKPSAPTRGCLTPAQLRGKGFALDSRGRWSDPEAVEAARKAFAA